MQFLISAGVTLYDVAPGTFDLHFWWLMMLSTFYRLIGHLDLFSWSSLLKFQLVCLSLPLPFFSVVTEEEETGLLSLQLQHSRDHFSCLCLPVGKSVQASLLLEVGNSDSRFRAGNKETGVQLGVVVRARTHYLRGWEKMTSSLKRTWAAQTLS